MSKQTDENKKKETKHNAGETADKKPGEARVDTGDNLSEQLAEKEKEAAANYDKYVRSVAELENFKKHAAREKADLLRFGNENIIKDILPILDSLDRALDHAENTKEIESIIKGLKIIYGQFVNCLEKCGVKRVETIGQEFDPNMHEAIQCVESNECEGNKVVEEFEKGYLLNDRLLKPAKVSVSKRKPSEK
jgi:molecular chaperone GrpE